MKRDKVLTAIKGAGGTHGCAYHGSRRRSVLLPLNRALHAVALVQSRSERHLADVVRRTGREGSQGKPEAAA